MTPNLASILPGVVAAAGIALMLVLGIIWLAVLLRTRAKLQAMEKSLEGSPLTGDTQAKSQ